MQRVIPSRKKRNKKTVLPLKMAAQTGIAEKIFSELFATKNVLTSTFPLWRRGKKTVALLSFDGGGSRGVMEIVIVDIIFKMATIILENPTEMKRSAGIQCILGGVK